MNEMNDGPARDLNPQPSVYQANALPTELLGLADARWRGWSQSQGKTQA